MSQLTFKISLSLSRGFPCEQWNLSYLKLRGVYFGVLGNLQNFRRDREQSWDFTQLGVTAEIAWARAVLKSRSPRAGRHLAVLAHCRVFRVPVLCP